MLWAVWSRAPATVFGGFATNQSFTDDQIFNVGWLCCICSYTVLLLHLGYLLWNKLKEFLPCLTKKKGKDTKTKDTRSSSVIKSVKIRDS